jgi:hypothetical protein
LEAQAKAWREELVGDVDEYNKHWAELRAKPYTLAEKIYMGLIPAVPTFNTT